MIYSKSRNFLFLRVPKTASTSINIQILDVIQKSDVTVQTSILYDDGKIQSIGSVYTKHPNYHPNLKELIALNVLQEADLLHLNVYGVIREPIDRIISCAQHYCNRFKKTGESFSNNQAVERLFNCDHDTQEYDKFVLDKPQSRWLVHNNQRINKIFRYDQIHLIAKEICGEESIKHNLRSEYRAVKLNDLSEELQSETRRRFPEDFAIWESLQPPHP